MKQKDALNILKAGKNVYLTGAAGSGKTYVLNDYISYLKDRGVAVGVTASTGIAATHIGGITIHSWSGAGIKNSLSDRDIEYLTEKEHLYKRFEKTEVLIIDEVSMLTCELFDSIERVSRAMKRSEKPFGGMQIVLSGDFFQLPPIASSERKADFIYKSEAWKNMDLRICYLDEQFRQDDSSLLSILNEMRRGEVSSATRATLGEIFNKKSERDSKHTRLYTHNADVDSENEEELNKLPGDAHIYQMSGSGKTHIVETLKKSILAPEILRLKKKAKVMFVKNAFESGYVNGTLGSVEDFDSSGMPIVRTLSGKKIFVAKAEWTVEEDGKILAKVEQLPIRLAWAITVHKSQGMSLDGAEIDLSRAFVPGQGYVALSRLCRLSGLALKGLNEMALSVDPRAAEIDTILISESMKWQKVLKRFDEKEMSKMHVSFLLKIGGTIDEEEIKKNKEKLAEPYEKISTYEKTLALIKENFSIADMAKSRKMTIGTIINHLEKLKSEDPNLKLEIYKPKEKDFKIIKDTFNKSKDKKLTPIHKKLKGRYSFEDLRLARLFMEA